MILSHWAYRHYISSYQVHVTVIAIFTLGVIKCTSIYIHITLIIIFINYIDYKAQSQSFSSVITERRNAVRADTVELVKYENTNYPGGKYAYTQCMMMMMIFCMM